MEEKIKPHVKKLFLVHAALSCFTCYARPDYNLPLFAFAFLLWDPPSKQVLTKNIIKFFNNSLIKK